MTHHDLDNAIAEALRRLAQPTSTTDFDYQKYITAFRESAQKKAVATLAELSAAKSPFRDLRPVFVSIGGGDGEELIKLLRQSQSTCGILVEHSTALADAARRRAYEVHPKTMLVLEGDAQERLADAMREAERFAGSGQADWTFRLHENESRLPPGRTALKLASPHFRPLPFRGELCGLQFQP